MMKALHKGFSLIELMIVVAIAGILAAVALPAYQDYTIRAKMSEVVLAMSACRTTITEYYQTGGTPPAANAWGCEQGVTSRYVKSISTDANGSVTATVQNVSADANDSMVTMFPLNSGGAAATSASDMGKGLTGWTCGGTGTSLNYKYLPSSCRGS